MGLSPDSDCYCTEVPFLNFARAASKGKRVHRSVTGGTQPWGQQLKAQPWFLLLPGKAVRAGLSLGEMPHSLIVQHLHSLLAKLEGDVKVKPLPLG